MHCVGREPVFSGEDLADIAAGRLAWVKRERAACGNHDDVSTNRSRLKIELSSYTAAIEQTHTSLQLRATLSASYNQEHMTPSPGSETSNGISLVFRLGGRP